MRKLILFLLMLQLFCVISLAQEKAKPTKQETMDWIAEKFKTNISYYGGKQRYEDSDTSTFSYSFLEYNQNKITIKREMEFSKSGKVRINFYIIDLTKVEGIETKTNSFAIKGKNLTCENETQQKNCDRSVSYFLLYGKDEAEDFLEKVIDFDGEPNLKDRMIKALQALAAYNLAEKPKEAF